MCVTQTTSSGGLMSDTAATDTAVIETEGEVVELVEEDLLVEDVSIDGMCGVY
jgi:mycofactocin precursor